MASRLKKYAAACLAASLATAPVCASTMYVAENEQVGEIIETMPEVTPEEGEEEAPEVIPEEGEEEAPEVIPEESEEEVPEVTPELKPEVDGVVTPELDAEGNEVVIVEEFVAEEAKNTNLPFNTLVSCQVSQQNSKNRYILNLRQPGRVEISVMAYMKYGRVRLYSQDGSQITNFRLTGGSSTSPISKTNYYDLEAGTYYIDLERDGVDGQYQMKVGHTSVEVNEQEPNNGTVIAQLIEPNGEWIKGFISETDSLDVFKVELAEAGRLSLNMASSLERSYFRLGDANRKYILNEYLYYGSNENPAYCSKYLDLEAGTYYIYIDQDTGTGKYQFNLEFEAANSDDIEPNNGTVTA